MANRLTRVPDAPPPALPRVVDALVPVADLFMALLFSRPAAGSLRSTWVTPATLWLAVLTASGALAVIPLTVASLGGIEAVAAVTALALFSAGSLSVAVIGAAQRGRRTHR